MLAINLGVVLLLLTSCFGNKEVKPPERPESVPAEAQWYGGPDGGAWVLIKKSMGPNKFEIKVFFDTTGDLWESGVFETEDHCPDKDYTVEELRKKIGAFDGVHLLLTDTNNGKYCTLVKK